MLLDTVRQEELALIGQWIWNEAGKAVTFSASSSGLEYALVAYWQKAGLIERPLPFASPGQAEKLVIISGSASPTTAAQIEHGRQLGYPMMKLPCAKLLNPATREATICSVVDDANRILREKDVLLLVFRARPRTIRPSRRLMTRPVKVGSRLPAQSWDKFRVPCCAGSSMKRETVGFVWRGGTPRAIAPKALGIFALRMIIPVAPGAPLCRAYADGPFDGLAISLKGGQCGKADYFQCIQKGGT